MLQHTFRPSQEEGQTGAIVFVFECTTPGVAYSSVEVHNGNSKESVPPPRATIRARTGQALQ
eukprot:6187583-Pleurochrysis_carterae.AAC.8